MYPAGFPVLQRLHESHISAEFQPINQFGSNCEKFLRCGCYIVLAKQAVRYMRPVIKPLALSKTICSPCTSNWGDDEDCFNLDRLFGCICTFRLLLLVLDGFWGHLCSWNSFGHHRGLFKSWTSSTNVGKRVRSTVICVMKFGCLSPYFREILTLQDSHVIRDWQQH